jgi:hypothetical protein
MTHGLVVAMVAAGASMASAEDSFWAGRAREVAAERLALANARGAAGEFSSLPGAFGRDTRGTAWVEELPSFRLAADAPADAQPAIVLPETATQPAAGTCCEVQRGPLPGFFETVVRDVKEMPRLLWHDTKAVYGNAGNLIFLVGAGGASIALRPEADDDIEDHYRKHHTFPSGERDTFDALGNPATGFAVAGLWYVAGQMTQDIKTYEVGKRAFSALIITDVSTLLLKLAACTESPNGTNLAWPSGHTSSTMALATVLHDAYGPLVGIPMYGVTALVGIERLDSREHHFSDVIFGAALGWTVSHTIMKEHKPEICGGEITPYIDPQGGNAGVAWVKPLGN